LQPQDQRADDGCSLNRIRAVLDFRPSHLVQQKLLEMR
jgi:hypothetical protein